MIKFLKSVFKLLFIENETEEFVLEEYREGSNEKETFVSDTDFIDDKGAYTDISKNIDDNIKYIKKAYSIPQNSDIVLRNFKTDCFGFEKRGFLLFIDGMASMEQMNESVLKPLLISKPETNENENLENLLEYKVLQQVATKRNFTIEKVLQDVNFGNCAVFLDGCEYAIIADVKGFKQRGVDKAENEKVIRGPQEAFTENIRTNTSLIRRFIQDHNLIIEGLSVGSRSNTPVAVMYIKNIVNDKLLNEVKKRIKKVDVDYLISSGQLEQLIEDKWYLNIPQIMSTERPDKAGYALTHGKVVVLVNGSPYALIMPNVIYDYFKSPEDRYVRFTYSEMFKIIRILGIAIALLLPGLYIAAINFHHEMIPADFLFAIEASREKVPFPSIIELLIMELAFELLREAGIRVPGAVGQTLGIIGGLILGQAAVSANLVSPFLIVIVSLTGLGSFAIPDYSFNFAVRISKYLYIIAGASLGFLGIAIVLFVQIILTCSASSFGVPFMAPLAPRTKGGFFEAVFKKPSFDMKFRPDYLNVKHIRQQSNKSRKWNE